MIWLSTCMSCMAAAWTESHSGGCLRTGSGSVSLIKSRVVLPLRIAVRSQVRAYPLRTRLPDVEPGAILVREQHQHAVRPRAGALP